MPATATDAFAWHALPGEMKLAILEKLALHDVFACGQADKKSYAACIPLLFRTVNLPSYEALQAFLATVPAAYRPFIHHLDVCTKSAAAAAHSARLDAFTPHDPPHVSHALAALLSDCASLESLSLAVGGSPAPAAILRAFRAIERVKKLRLINWEQEEVRPFSERLAVSLAFALPRLEDLTLVRITRSAAHAPELAFSTVPLVTGDFNANSTNNSDSSTNDPTNDSTTEESGYIPPHPLLGHELRLPQLLRLPHLRRLKLRDTHLGDPLWAASAYTASAAACCPLEVLDLGACAHVPPHHNDAHTARILAAVPASIQDFSLSSALSSSTTSSSSSSSNSNTNSNSNNSLSAKGDDSAAAGGATGATGATATTPTPPPALPHLRTLHLTPLVPTSALASTLAQPALAGSPVHTLSCAFDPDDAADGCAALEAFLRERSERAGRIPQPQNYVHPHANANANGHPHANAQTHPNAQKGRKRSGSKLVLCETFTEEPASAPAAPSLDSLTSSEKDHNSTNNNTNNTNTTKTFPPSPSHTARNTTPLSPLYPALRTLSIDVPALSAPVASQSLTPALSASGAGTSGAGSTATTTGKLSPRRLAAARRRAEARRAAAARLLALATQLGLDVVVRGIDGVSVDGAADVDADSAAGDGGDAAPGDVLADLSTAAQAKPLARSRANSTL